MFQGRLKRAIKLRGYTQEKLAEKCGITEVTLSRYVRGGREPRAGAIRKIAETLNVSTDWLLGLSDKMDRQTDDPLAKMKDSCFYIMKDGILYEAKVATPEEMGAKTFNIKDKTVNIKEKINEYNN